MAADIELFQRLFKYVNAAHPEGLERDWRYLDMQIWPVVKAQIVMRASNVFCAGRSMALKNAREINEQDDRAVPPEPCFFDRIFGLTGSGPRNVYAPPPQEDEDLFDEMDWPDFPANPEDVERDVICFGYATNHKKFGKTYFQLCMDPCRLAFERAGYSSACFVTGLKNDDPSIEHAALDNTFGIEAEIRTVRRFAQKLPDVNLRDCPGFMDMWHGLNDIVGDQQYVTIEHIENIVKQTRVVGEWIYRSFKASPPKTVLVAAYYGLVGHGSSWAFRRMGVNVADIQHGVTGLGHHAYSWPTAPADTYQTLPSHFLVWSNTEYRHFSTGSGDWMPGLVVIGNIWRLLDDVLAYEDSESLFPDENRRSAVAEMSSYRTQFETLKASGDSEAKDVLVALHPDEGIDWLKKVKREAPAGWRYHIRLHPGEYNKAGNLEKRIKAFPESAGYYVELPTQAPLNIVLQECDIILTKYSSVALDALAYAVPTVAYSDAAEHFFGKPEFSRVKVVLPMTSAIVAGMNQRLSSYGETLLRPQPNCDFAKMGAQLVNLMIGLEIPKA